MFNPNLENDDEDQLIGTESGDDNGVSPANVSTSLLASPVPAPLNPQVSEYLKNKMAFADAQGKASKNILLANLSRAAGAFGNAISGSGQAFDSTPYDALAKQANLPVEQVVAQQKEDKAEADQEATDTSNARSAALSDPESQQSKATQGLIAKLYPGKFTPEELSHVAAADAQESIFKPLELDQKIKSAAQSRSDALDAKSASFDQKNSDNQDKAYTSMRKDLESFRGNQAVQQSAKDVLSADKTLAMVKDKDPNTLTTQDLSLLASEMSKIATGGVPTEHGVQSLMPSNLQTKLAELKNFVMSRPSDANAADYIKKNMSYLNEMRAVANKTLTDYRSNIAKGYKARVKPDQYTEAQADYNFGGSTDTSNALPNGQSIAPSSTPQHKAGDFVMVKGKKYQVGPDGDSLSEAP